MKMTKNRYKARKHTGTSNDKLYALPKEQLVDKFHRTVSKGPCHMCAACSQLRYRQSIINMRSLSTPNLSEKAKMSLRNVLVLSVIEII